MNFFPICVCVVFLFIVEINSDGSRNDGVVLSRRKRYVAFPEGATFIFAFCMTNNVIVPSLSIFTEGVNWGIAFDLPNRTYVQDLKRNKKQHFLKRRQRRDLYNGFETIMDSMGYNGRPCVYRALCEAPRRLKSQSNTLSEHFLHLLFKFPEGPISDCEPEDHRLYHWAYRRGKEHKQQDCRDMYPECPISLIDMALGYYNDYTHNSPFMPF